MDGIHSLMIYLKNVPFQLHKNTCTTVEHTVTAESPFTTLQTEQRSPLRGPGVGSLGVILSSRRSSRSRSRHPSCRGAERAAGSGPPGSAPRKPAKMPGLTAPSDYAEEPPRHPALKINAKEPFNAEPHRSALVASYITPVDFFYKRNHGPIPKVEDLSRYTVSISGLVNKSIQLSMGDIWALPKYNVTATLQCAGNRRTAMSNVRKVRGVGWDISALGTATWGGAKLSDVLELVGIPKLSAVTSLGGKHVEFVSVDKCKEEKGGPYTASIPLKQATDPDADVLLAYEMNGEVLNRDHGYPLRVVVPGVIGARSVKWLDSINIKEEECQGFFMQKDYKMFPPTVDWDNINWSTRRPQMDFPVQSAICTLEDVDVIKEGKARIAGYALSGGGRGIERVDISVDGGKTWVEARRYQKDNVAYVSDGPQSDKWAWVLFEATVDIPANAEIVAKAVDSAANVQPEKVEDMESERNPQHILASDQNTELFIRRKI